MIRSMAGGYTLETVTNFYSKSPWNTALAFPNSMKAPMAVVNNGRQRTIVFVNDGTNPTDYTNGFPSVAMTATFNIAAWKCAGRALAAPVDRCACAGSYVEMASGGSTKLQLPDSVPPLPPPVLHHIHPQPPRRHRPLLLVRNQRLPC